MAATTPTHRPPPPSQSGWGRRQVLTIVLLCGALFLDAMNTSSVNVALPTIGSQLRLSDATLQWVVSSYLLGFGGFLLLGGRTADLIGRRVVFLWALVVFAASSLASGLVSGGTLLIAASFVKGVAAAFTVPAGLSILTTTFTDPAGRNRALGAWAATGAGGFTLGLVFGGLLSQVGWRWVFLAPVPLAVALIVVGLRVLERSPRPVSGDTRYDLPGAAAITASMMALVFSVVEAPSRGWSDPRTIGGLALAAVLLVAFVAIETRSPSPLVRLGLLKTRSVVVADVAGMLHFGSFLGFQFIATLYLQDVAGWSPIATSLAFLPEGALLIVAGAQAERIIGRFGTQTLIAAGLLAFAGAYALFLREDSAHLTYATMLLPSIGLIGVGWALGFPALNVQATAGADEHEQGLAAGLFNTSFQIGGAVGVAIVSTVLSSHVGASGQAGAVLASIRPALLILIPIALAGVALLALVRGRGRGAQDPAGEPSALAGGATC